MSPCFVGVDLGGTNIRAAVATSASTFANHVSERTPAQEGPDAVCDAMASAIRKAAGEAPLGGVAIGVPGPLNPETGIVFAAPHLKRWTNVPLVQMMEDRLRCPVAIQNDANLAGYGEWTAGAGKGVKTLVFITISTGVGGALILDGKLWAGVTGTAGEIGHTPLGPNDPPCAQGHPGCLEGSASGTAIARKGREAVASGKETRLRDIPDESLDAEAVEMAARAGDAVALEIYHEAARALGRMLGGLINLINPELIVIGGGLIQAHEIIFQPMIDAVAEMAFEVPRKDTKIVIAGLGTDAGLVGAVAWAMHEFGSVHSSVAVSSHLS
ncbi:MAG: ROK family protein [Candidatus Dormibacteria bacterium]